MKKNFKYLYYRVRFHKVNVMVADGMAPCITRSSVLMRLIMQNREVLVYYEEEIQLPVSCVLSEKKKSQCQYHGC